MRMNFLYGTVLLAAVLLLTAGQALAGDGYYSPDLDYSPPWLSTLYALVATAAICVPAFKNARRTHLD